MHHDSSTSQPAIPLLLQGDFTLDTSGLPTLDLQIPVPNEDPSAIGVTPGAFADGSALIALQNGEQRSPQPAIRTVQQARPMLCPTYGIIVLVRGPSRAEMHPALKGECFATPLGCWTRAALAQHSYSSMLAQLLGTVLHWLHLAIVLQCVLSITP